MAGCGPCPDSCNCIVADEAGVIYPGSGDAGSPIIVPRAVPETTFAATSTGATIVATPAGTAGHTPNLEVAICNILQESAERQNGRLVIFSNDADCKPERLRDPVTNEYLGFDPGSGEATWLTLPTGFSIVIDPASTAPVSYGVDGLRVDCCPADPQTVTYDTVGTDTFDPDDYPGMTAVRVRAVGGGGGSGGSAATGSEEASAAGGGGSSAYAEATIPVASLGGPVTVTIGAGGAAGAAGNNDGASGADTSFGAFVVADGGGGGMGSASIAPTATTLSGPGGAGGLVANSTGDVKIPGSQGGNGWVDDGRRNFGAYGAASLLGAQIQPGTSTGIAGSVYGSGAAGANTGTSGSAHAGAAGSKGVCIVDVIY